MNATAMPNDLAVEYRRAGLELLARLAAEFRQTGNSQRLSHWLRRVRELRANAQIQPIGHTDDAMLADLERSLAIAMQLVCGKFATGRSPAGSPLGPRPRQ